MLNDILYVIIFVLYTVCFYHYLTFSFHMLQLSSYHNPTHLLYENNHQRYIYAPYKVFLCLPPLMLLIGRGFFTAALILSLPVMLWFAYISKPLKAKKPFVVTARVKRLYCAAFVLYGIVCLTAFLCPICHPSFLLALTAVFSVFIYPFTRLCNTINRPIERSVANHYIKEARDILKSKKDMTVIGITGSYGKTSTKYFLNSILSYRFESLMTPASYNTTMGVVRTVRENLKPTTSHFVVEMGARHLGEIKEICDIVHPNMGIIASIGPQHLETFGSLDNVVKAKMELYDAVKQNGTVFLNIDSDPIYENLPTEGKIVTYGIKRDADYMAYDLSVSEMGISFYVKTPEGETERFTTKLLGAHNVLNILGAVSVAHKLGMSLKSMTVPVACLEAVPHRLEIKGGGENVIIDDAYNSNPIGAKAALDALNLCDGMKIIITPGMVELGDREYELNKIFGTQIAEICDYVCLVGADHIYDGLVEAGFDESKIFRTKDVREAINHATSLKSTKNGKKYILLENDLPDNY